jgi:predicted DNA-binding mobile mystery protein A
MTLRTPPEGWLRTVRTALGTSGAQLAKKMGLTRARIAQAEQAELSGAFTLKSMQAIAEAMGRQLVDAIVPPGRVEDLVIAQARKKALALVGAASEHMALESQTLPDGEIAEEISASRGSWCTRRRVICGTTRDARDYVHRAKPIDWAGGHDLKKISDRRIVRLHRRTQRRGPRQRPAADLVHRTARRLL